MDLKFRRAVPSDAKDVFAIANIISKKYKEANGSTSVDLSASGFLLYPLVG